MGNRSKVTPQTSDSENGELFTDGDFEYSDDDIIIGLDEDIKTKHSNLPQINETMNVEVKNPEVATNGINVNSASDVHIDNVDGLKTVVDGQSDGVNGHGHNGYVVNTNGGGSGTDALHNSHQDYSPCIVGIIGNQHNHAEQRLAARRAARAEAREIRMRELERQQREQEDHADKAYDMYAGEDHAPKVGRRGPSRPSALHSPRRSSEDSAEDGFCIKDLRHDLKELEDKFRKAMILNAQLDNDKASLAYQLELLKDRIEELQEEYAQLQREHREKCSAHERLKREHLSVERELCAARGGIRARDAAAGEAGFAFVEAESEPTTAEGPALALVSHASEQLLNDAGEGTLDVRLQKLLSTKQGLESEVRKLKLQLNEERAARQNGVAHPDDDLYESEVESLRKGVAEAKGRAARAEAEAALQGAAVARLEAQVARLRARQDHQDEHEEQLKQERRRLQREAREALNRVEELETENSHLTKRLDKLKNAKSALLKDL